jgi:hypothetical protein
MKYQIQKFVLTCMVVENDINMMYYVSGNGRSRKESIYNKSFPSRCPFSALQLT